MLHTCYRAHAGLRIPPADHTRPCSAARHPSCGPPASTPSGKPGLPNARPSAPDLGVAHGHHLPWRLPRSPTREPTFQARCAITPPTTDSKSVVKGKSVSVRVDIGGQRIITKKNTTRL